ncbi:transglycosylase family protein [Streptacidiphilus sp. PAMC 29251]
MLFTTPVAGRHRKPRSSSTARLVATASLGTAGIALPLIGATSASAASVSTWDKVASCESGGDWSINTGNGYYGGLQFSASTWAGYGGTAYASTANHASKGQQITIAEKVLAAQGPGAWPVCGPRAGLSQGGGAPVVSTTPTKKAPAKKAPAKKTTTTHSTTKQTSTGKHSGAGSSTHSVKTTPSTPKHAAPSVQQASPTHSTGHGDYTVKPGDTLSGIAASAHLGGGWKALYQENRSTVGGNPDLIFPGQRLDVG